jgi:hypothetical protein
MNDHSEQAPRAEQGGQAEQAGRGGATDERQHVWDNPRNVKLLFGVFYALCAIVAGLDLVIHRHEVHVWERILGFYPLYGFVGIVLLVAIAKQMRRLLMRSEDYYDG